MRNGNVLSMDRFTMQDFSQDPPTSHDSAPLACKGVSPTTYISIDDIDDDTHKEEEDYCEELLHTFTIKICIHIKPNWKWNYYVVVV